MSMVIPEQLDENGFMVWAPYEVDRPTMMTHCSMCSNYLSDRERSENVEIRPTASGRRPQKWSYCDGCYEGFV
jgi:uncharacterized protein with PIN domain